MTELQKKKQSAIESLKNKEWTSILVISAIDEERCDADSEEDGVHLTYVGREDTLAQSVGMLMFEDEDFQEIILNAVKMCEFLQQSKVMEN